MKKSETYIEKPIKNETYIDNPRPLKAEIDRDTIIIIAVFSFTLLTLINILIGLFSWKRFKNKMILEPTIEKEDVNNESQDVSYKSVVIMH